MTRIGIVGTEAAKFTPAGEARAKAIIRGLLAPYPCILVSGGCHLGGVDIFAERMADELGRKKIIYLPKEHSWPYYKYRNLQIATTANIVHCITVDKIPSKCKGHWVPFCYHCNIEGHVKSGGCWTMKKATHGQLHVVQNGD